MKIPTHPAIDFLRAYWKEVVGAIFVLALAIFAMYMHFENRALKATLVNATTTIANYKAAAKDNARTISTLEAANKAWADAAIATQDLIAQQSAIIAGKEAGFRRKEETLKDQLEKAHAQHKDYSSAGVPDAIAKRLRQNSSAD
jgi:hypothetical protein